VKSTVTTLRASAAATEAASLAPQREQNRASVAFSRPQLGQTMDASLRDEPPHRSRLVD
jgi:hypothetical protein